MRDGGEEEEEEEEEDEVSLRLKRRMQQSSRQRSKQAQEARAERQSEDEERAEEEAQTDSEEEARLERRFFLRLPRKQEPRQLSAADRRRIVDDVMRATNSQMLQINRIAPLLYRPKPGTTAAAASSSSSASALLQSSALLTGGQLKPYQSEGVAWLLSLYRLRLSGAILADEMGLGKTIQTIAFICQLAAEAQRQQPSVSERSPAGGPHLVVVPLSTIGAWEDALRLWAPSLSLLVHQGSKEERRDRLRRVKWRKQQTSAPSSSSSSSSSSTAAALTPASALSSLPPPHRKPTAADRKKQHTDVITLDDDSSSLSLPTAATTASRSPSPFSAASRSPSPAASSSSSAAGRQYGFDVLLTSYEVCMKDAYLLTLLPFNLLVVDEAARIHNPDTKLSHILSSFRCRFKLLLTGTPLQNAVGELLALLRFINPQLFDSGLEQLALFFSKPFRDDAEDEEGRMEAAERTRIVSRLHDVIRPFMLRRVKADVLRGELTQRREVVIYCPMSGWQAAIYSAIQLNAKLAFLQDKLGVDAAQQPWQPTVKIRSFNNVRLQRNGTLQPCCRSCLLPRLTTARHLCLSQVLMQLRKTVNHPYLFYCSPASSSSSVPQRSEQYPLDAELIRCSGKLCVLHSLVLKLRAAGHQLLIFSQFTSVLDILCDWAELVGHRYLRLDGGTKAAERPALVAQFNAPSSPYPLFFLSTRAGGLGLNLPAASTVIIFDSDWNPQADEQAAGRAHRIGQSRDVQVCRLMVAGGVEERIWDRQREKLRTFRGVVDAGSFTIGRKEGEKERLSVIAQVLLQPTPGLQEPDVDSDGKGRSSRRKRIGFVVDADGTERKDSREEDQATIDVEAEAELEEEERYAGCGRRFNALVARDAAELQLFNTMDREFLSSTRAGKGGKGMQEEAKETAESRQRSAREEVDVESFTAANESGQRRSSRARPPPPAATAAGKKRETAER